MTWNCSKINVLSWPGALEIISGFWRQTFSHVETPQVPRSRYQQAMEEFRADKFRRLLLSAVIGVCLAHYLDMPNTVLIGLYPASFMLGMDRFTFGEVISRCAAMLRGLAAGIVVIEVFQSMPYMAVLTTYWVFFFMLKCFARGLAVNHIYSFGFTYCLASINAGYPNSTMEQAFGEYYLLQAVLIVFVVWGCFAIFPSEKPRIGAPVVCRQRPIPNVEMALYAAIWLAIWIFFQLFEWKFALFAFLSFIGAFRYFERPQMKKVMRENVIVHTLSCSMVALFSILLFTLTDHFLVFILSIVVLLAPFLHYAVYPPTPALAYRGNTMVPGLLVPLTLYVGTDHAAVFQSSLRARLIILLMIFLWGVVEFMYHAKNSIKFTRRMVKKSLAARKG